jgi:uncharacterized membrane protein
MHLTTKQLVQVAALSAISAFLGFSRLGFIPFFLGISLTIMHVPVIIGAILTGPIGGTIIGLMFGIASMIQANVAPNGPGDVPFTDPLISVLPRLFIGVAAWGGYWLFKKFKQKEVKLALLVIMLVVLDVIMADKLRGVWDPGTARWFGLVIIGLGILAQGYVVLRALKSTGEEISYQVAAIAGTLTNTILVLTMLSVRGHLERSLLWTVGSLYGSAEAVVAALITTAVLTVWLQSGKTKKAKLE